MGSRRSIMINGPGSGTRLVNEETRRERREGGH
jgi:hypothetical protein